ncbi:hypothetical protein [Listeria welshimeri]|uniref:hypothetical protein n=1 Tax=Listeria welshimeri TaxID=1643 RepID=UPI001888086D|nr:hypothetical protein [Listeria welshimeri]MBF2456583.1 hypothetical protein [Listeria welshimeri]
MKDGNILNLLLRPLSDEGITDLLTYLHINKSKIKLKEYRSSTLVDNEKMGVILKFTSFFEIMDGLVKPDITISPELSEKIKNISALPESTLFLITINITNENIDNLGFSLPHNLDFNMTKTDVINMFGVPVKENPKIGSMRWYFDTHRLVVRFEDNSLTITSLEVSMLNNAHLRLGL